tara:strand:- start:7807 stop:16566 length:8760 start_codon:yes stop_codon:yes gene_type:complete
MPEIKKQFTGGKMNRDLDERLVPDGEYRDAMNIQVSTSEDSDVGTIQNILGNVPGCTYPDAQGYDNPINDGSEVVATISDEKADSIYWFVSGQDKTTSVLINDINNNDISIPWAAKDIIMRKTPNGCEPVFIDAYGSVQHNTETTNSNTLVLGDPDQMPSISPGMTVFGINIFGQTTSTTPTITGVSTLENIDVTYTSGESTGPMNLIFNSTCKLEAVIAKDGTGTASGFVMIPAAQFVNEIQVGQPIQLSEGPDQIVDLSTTTITNIQNVFINSSDGLIGEFYKLTISNIIVNQTTGNSITNSVDNFGMLTGTYNVIIDASGIGTYANSTIYISDVSISALPIIYNILVDASTGVPTGKEIAVAYSSAFPNGAYSPSNPTGLGSYCLTTPPPPFVNPNGTFLYSNEFQLQPCGMVGSINFSRPAQFSNNLTLILPPDTSIGQTVSLSENLDLSSGYEYLRFDRPRSLKFKEDNIVTGINIIEDLLFWTDGTTEPKKINIPRSIEGTDPDGMHHTVVINKERNLGRDGVRIPIEEKHLTVIKKSPKNALDMKLVRKVREGEVTAITRIRPAPGIPGTSHAPWFYEAGLNSNLYNFKNLRVGDSFSMSVESATGVVTYDGPAGSYSGPPGWNYWNVDWQVGDNVVFKPAWEDGTLPMVPISEGFMEAKVEVVGKSNNRKITMVEVTVTAHDIDYSPEVGPGSPFRDILVDLMPTSEPLFESKFSRFAYRYKYEDGEYSTFSPWTNPAFLPGGFYYHPKEGYNLGMVNNLRTITLSNFIGKDTPKDVTEIEILMKDEISANIYSVTTIRPNDVIPFEETQNTWKKNSYVITSETINNVLPENQLLRPWDNVPRFARAQEITGNRLVFANYVQNFNLRNKDGKIYSPSFNFTTKSSYWRKNSELKSIKSLRDYQVGVVLMDEYGRETPVLTSASGTLNLEKSEADKKNRFKVTLQGASFPEEMDFIKFYIKEASGEYYSLSLDRYYDAGDGQIWLAFPSTSRNKLTEETFLILKKGVDKNNLVVSPGKYKVLAIENEAPEFIKTNKNLISSITHTTAVPQFSLSSTSGAPKEGVKEFEVMLSDSYAGSTARALQETSEGYLYFELSLGDKKSDRYKIARITTDVDYDDSSFDWNTAKYFITTEKHIKFDMMQFFDNIENPTHISPGCDVNFYHYTIENKPQFDGRFFAKINDDDIFKQNVDPSAEEVAATFRVSEERQIFALKDNFYEVYDDHFDNDDLNSDYTFSSSGASTGIGKWNCNGCNDPDGSTDFFGNSSGTFSNNVKVRGTDDSGNPKNTGYGKWWDYAVKHKIAKWNRAIKWAAFAANSLDATNPGVWVIDAGPYVGQQQGSNFSHTYGTYQHFNNQNQSSWQSAPTDNKGIKQFVEGYPGQASYTGEPTKSEIDISFLGLSSEEGIVSSEPHNNGTGYYYYLDYDNFYKLEDGGNPQHLEQSKFGELMRAGNSFRWKQDPSATIYKIHGGVEYRNQSRHSCGNKSHTQNTSDQGTSFEDLNECGDGTGAFNGPAGGIGWGDNLWYSRGTTLPVPNIAGTWHNHSSGKRFEVKPAITEWDPYNDGLAGPINNGNVLGPGDPNGDNKATFSSKDISVNVRPSITINVDADGKIWDTRTESLKSVQDLVGMLITSYNDSVFSITQSSVGNAVVQEIETVSSTQYKLHLTGYTSKIDATSDVPASPNTNEYITFEQPALNGYTSGSVAIIAHATNYPIQGNTTAGVRRGPIYAVNYSLQFLEEEIEEVLMPRNPAIFETEPNEGVDLDIYYEASGPMPLRLNTNTLSTAIPIGSRIFHEKLEWAAFTVGQENQVVDTHGFSTIELLNPVGLQANSVNQADYLTIGDVLMVHKPDGHAFSVVVKSLISDILIELEEELYNSSHFLNWHNCYSYGNGVESNRIRESFNKPFISSGVKASTTTSEKIKEEIRGSGLIYSGIYNSTSGVNNLNQFIQAEKITKDINPVYGKIQKLFTRDSDLVTLCEDKVLRILANKDAVFNADGNPQLTATDKVLGQAIPFSGEYGISTDPESFASESYRAYFTDRQRGAVLRLSRDGLTPISNYGMKDWFKDNLGIADKVIGSYDDRQENYNISFHGEINKSISFKEDVKGWVSFKSFVAELGGSVTNNYYTFKEGNIWQHEVPVYGDTARPTVATNYNMFYGAVESTPSYFNVLLNNNPSVVKSFQTLNYEGTQSKIDSLVNATVDGVLYSDDQFYNLQERDGWFVYSVKTDKEKGSINEFMEKEGKWFNYLKGKEVRSNNRGVLITDDDGFSTYDTASFAIQGIGVANGAPVVASAVGCMDDTAFNFNSGALIPCNGCCYPVISGCLNNIFADNFIIPTGNPQVDVNTDDGSCVQSGCTDATAFNYNPNATQDDGSCVPVILGCTNNLTTIHNGTSFYTMSNYNQYANTDDGSCQVATYGCTDVLAINFDEFNNFPTVDDGTCYYSTVPLGGCNDYAGLYNNIGNWGACNYNIAATFNDGTCEYSSCVGCMDTMYEEYCATCYNGGPWLYNNQNACINYSTIGCTDPVMYNYNPGAITDDGSCVPFVYGCSNAFATNYDPAVNTDDGTCVYGCCVDNFVYDPTYVWTGSAVALVNPATGFYYDTSPLDNVNNYIYPNYDGRISWKSDANSCTPNSIAVVHITAPSGYTISSYASPQDFSIDVDGSLVWQGISAWEANNSPWVGAGDWEARAYYGWPGNNPPYCPINPFTLGGTGPGLGSGPLSASYPAQYGCTDDTAFNYDATATINDGTCIPVIVGCTDPTGSNYHPDFNTDSGACTYCNTTTGCGSYADIDATVSVSNIIAQDSNGDASIDITYGPTDTCVSALTFVLQEGTYQANGTITWGSSSFISNNNPSTFTVVTQTVSFNNASTGFDFVSSGTQQAGDKAYRLRLFALCFPSGSPTPGGATYVSQQFLVP